MRGWEAFSLLLTRQKQKELYRRAAGRRGGISAALALLLSESHTHPSWEILDFLPHRMRSLNFFKLRVSAYQMTTVPLMADVWCKMHVVMQHDDSSLEYLRNFILLILHLNKLQIPILSNYKTFFNSRIGSTFLFFSTISSFNSDGWRHKRETRNGAYQRHA